MRRLVSFLTFFMMFVQVGLAKPESSILSVETSQSALEVDNFLPFEDLDLECDPTSIFSQPLTGIYAAKSDYNAPVQLADDFELSSHALGIGAVEWWGGERTADSPFPGCEKTEQGFEITFYASGSVPGVLIYQEIVIPTKIETSKHIENNQTYGPFYKYSAHLSAPVHLEKGWISIVGLESTGCDFYWGEMTGSPSGYRYKAKSDTDKWSNGARNVDLSYCFLPADPGFHLSPMFSLEKGAAGDTITHTLTLYNNSGASDTIALSITGQNWPTMITSSNPVILMNNETALVTIEVQIPDDALLFDADDSILEAIADVSGSSISSTIRTIEGNEFACHATSIFSQPISGSAGIVSDLNRPIRLADDFTLPPSSPDIGIVEWWGRERTDVSPYRGCIKTNPGFEIVFYAPGSLPGDIVYQEDVIPVKIATTKLPQNSGPFYKYRADLSSPVSLTDGWISIAGLESEGCDFLWSGAEEGAGSNYCTKTGSGNWNLSPGTNKAVSFCLLPLPTPTPIPTNTPTETPTNTPEGPSPTPTQPPPIPTTSPFGIILALLTVTLLIVLPIIRKAI